MTEVRHCELEYAGQTLHVATPGSDHVWKNWSRRRTFFELDLLERIRRLELGGTYLDVGANLGNHALFFQHFTACEMLVCVEPHPVTAAFLQQNMRANEYAGLPLWILHRCAAAHRAGTCQLGGDYAGNTGSIHVLGPDGREDPVWATPPEAPVHTVPVRTIDLIARDERDVSLLKLDIEGFEHLAIRGARRTLHDHRPVVVAELPTAAERERFEELLLPVGYRIEGRYAVTPTYLYLPG